MHCCRSAQDNASLPAVLQVQRTARAIGYAIFILLAVNVAVLCVAPEYDVRFGPVHIAAHGLFKPLLLLNGAFLLLLVTRTCAESRYEAARSSKLIIAGLLAVTAALYWPTLAVNFQHHDWTHRHISAGIGSGERLWKLFVMQQADGFYRPLTFISLWADYRIFGDALWGYHLQSIALHFANSALLMWAALELGFAMRTAAWAALLFAVSAVAFEPVLWPAARFDLLAAAFTLSALACAARYLRSEETSWPWLAAMAACFAAALLSKESAYGFPPVLAALIVTRRVWPFPPLTRSKLLALAVVTGVVVACAIAARLIVYGGLGGYPAQHSPHFALSVKTITSLFTRVFPLSVFGVNTTLALPLWMRVDIVALAAILLLAIAGGSCTTQRDRVLLVCAALSALPMANIVGWIGPPLQHSRYLYMPGIWMALFLAAVLGRSRRATLLLAGLAIVNMAGAAYNVHVYTTMFQRADELAQVVRRDASRNPGINEVDLIGVPDDPNGVFYFASELTQRIEQELPGVRVRREAGEARARLEYRWDTQSGRLAEIH
jgi:hypothetical protein